jgi:RNA polymerase sigma-70 factor (ECF subfamily)
VSLPDADAVTGAETPPEQPLEVREALVELARRLPPKERAAVLLKDVFDLPLATIATWLETSVGAVKAALHRARGKLATDHRPPPGPPRAGPPRELLDRWCAAFNARDLEALTALLAPGATAEIVGVLVEHGRERIRDGSLHHTLFQEAGEPRAEVRELWSELVVVLRYQTGAGRKMRDVLRFAADESTIHAFRYYFYCPETLAEVAGELGLPLADNGYFYIPGGA